MPQIVEHRIVNLSNSTFGRVYHLNYPHPKGMPESIDYTQHLIAPSGDVISIELRGAQFTENGCNDSAVIEVCSSCSYSFLLIFSAFLETCFQKGSLIIHFVRLFGCSAVRLFGC